MTNEEKAQEIVNKQWEWIADFIEKNNLSKEDRNQIRFEMYGAILDMAKWKDEQLKESEYYISIPKAEYEELLYFKKQFLSSIKDSDNIPTMKGE